MKTLRRILTCIAAVLSVCLLGMAASADSGDNSLYSLGLGLGECSPEFYYSTLEYTITVPGGTTELPLDPVTSDPNATIVDISGTELDEDGSGTVFITVEAPNGAQVTYTLNVVPDGPPETTAEQSEAEAELQLQQELQRQSESEEAERRAAELENSKQQLTALSTQNGELTDRINLLLKVMYGLVGFAVLLLFFVINQSLRNKDLKEDLKEARSQAEANNEFARKEQSMQTNYYYTPHQNMQPNYQQPMQQPAAEASQNVQAAFGNAPQVLYAQPAPGQVSVPKQAPAETASAPQAPQGAPVRQEPALVQGQAQEPDVNVEMIDL